VKIRMACVMLLCSLGACGRAGKDVLVPLGRVLVYEDAEGSRIIGSITCPAKIVSIDWPDKTYYAVKIKFNTDYGFVTRGHFAICPDDTSTCYTVRVAHLAEHCKLEKGG